MCVWGAPIPNLSPNFLPLFLFESQNLEDQLNSDRNVELPMTNPDSRKMKNRQNRTVVAFLVLKSYTDR